MDLEPAQGGRVSGDGSGGELSRGDGDFRLDYRLATLPYKLQTN
jgi:hypothetical protein